MPRGESRCVRLRLAALVVWVALAAACLAVFGFTVEALVNLLGCAVIVAVTVTDLEPHGDQIRVRAGDLAADITPAASADLSLAPGVRAYFVVKAAAVAIYPA